MSWIFLPVAVLAGGLVAFLIMKIRLTAVRSEMVGQLALKDKELAVSLERIATAREEAASRLDEINTMRSRSEELSRALLLSQSEARSLSEKLESQKAELEELQKKFTTEFENIANKILRENSREFTFLNQKNIHEILLPLKDKIEKFEKKVEDTYEKGLRDQTDLKAELKKLHEVNTRISEEANSLTRALRSDTKKMGNWGELILDRILEQSGLEKGKEYFSQLSAKAEDGSTLRPDVVVMLPEKKHIIIDSKVSLVAYDRYVNTGDETEKERFLKAHIDSIREHVRGLSEKSYTDIPDLDSPDFVLLFMPLESAFSLALQNEPDLFHFAWQRRIIMVSPTTLLATLKTIESIWKHEKQTQNAMEIARQGTSLYEKFYNFINDLERVGNQINTLQSTYQEAHKKLTSGKGNLVRQAEKLKELGIKTEKSLTGKLLADNEE
jgi:DNA recombination protein RmuC